MRLSNQDYHQRPELSASKIKLLLDNPYKFLCDIPVVQTDDMLLGSVIHTLVLEPEIFDQTFTIMPKLNLRTKVGREAKTLFETQAGNHKVITNDMYQTAQSCSEAILKGRAGRLLQKGIAEQSFFGRMNDMECKCRPDYYVPERKMIVDIKKCADASFNGFTKANANFKYFIQAAFYSDLMAAIG